MGKMRIFLQSCCVLDFVCVCVFHSKRKPGFLKQDQNNIKKETNIRESKGGKSALESGVLFMFPPPRLFSLNKEAKPTSKLSFFMRQLPETC